MRFLVLSFAVIALIPGYLMAGEVSLEKFKSSGRCLPGEMAAYAEVAACSYRDEWQRVPDGYELVSKWGVEGYLEGTKYYRVADDGEITSAPHNTKRNATCLQARILHGPRGEIVVSFRGTDIVDWGDIRDDVSIIVGKLPDQCVDAARLLWCVLKHSDGAEIIVVGHSLGGALAQCAVAANDCHSRKVSCYIFNSMGIPSKTIASFDPARLSYANKCIVNFQMQGDAMIGGAQSANGVMCFFSKENEMKVLGTTVALSSGTEGKSVYDHGIMSVVQCLKVKNKK